MTLLELMQLVRKHLALVIALPLACAVIMGAYSYLFMPNTYTASTTLYVLASSDSESANSSNVYSDLTASQLIANDIATIIKSDTVTNKTAADLSMSSLKDYKIDVTSQTTTRVIELSVTGEDAASTAIIANRLAENVSSFAVDVANIGGVNVIDQAKTPEDPSGPNRPMYVAVALLAGLFVAIAIIVLADMVNTRVRSAEEVEELLGLPVIGRMPIVKGDK